MTYFNIHNTPIGFLSPLQVRAHGVKQHTAAGIADREVLAVGREAQGRHVAQGRSCGGPIGVRLQRRSMNDTQGVLLVAARHGQELRIMAKVQGRRGSGKVAQRLARLETDVVRDGSCRWCGQQVVKQVAGGCFVVGAAVYVQDTTARANSPHGGDSAQGRRDLQPLGAK